MQLDRKVTKARQGILDSLAQQVVAVALDLRGLKDKLVALAHLVVKERLETRAKLAIRAHRDQLDYLAYKALLGHKDQLDSLVSLDNLDLRG